MILLINSFFCFSSDKWMLGAFESHFDFDILTSQREKKSYSIYLA